MSPVQQKPILHGRDHSCGGADPIPLICELQKLIPGLWGGGDYTSQQLERWTEDVSGASGFRDVVTWPSITVTDIHQNLVAGNWLHARFACNAFAVDDIIVADIGNVSTGVAWTTPGGSQTVPDGHRISAEGYIYDPAGGTVTEGNVDTTYPDTETFKIRASSDYALFEWIENGVLILQWVDGTSPDPGSGTGTLWNGDYPIVDADIADDADIDPTKLEHPGGTSSFLRADGTWATPPAPVSDPLFLAREQGPMPGSPGSLGMYRVPYFDGAGVTFTLARASLHLETPGSTDSVLVIEKSSTADVFTPVEITTLTVASAAYSATDDTSGLGTIASGNLLRFRWSSLGTSAQSYHVQLEGAV